MKFKSAKDIQAFILASITALIQFPNNSETSVYKELSESSGLSLALVRHFHKGKKLNLTTNNLDRLMLAVKNALQQATL